MGFGLKTVGKEKENPPLAYNGNSWHIAVVPSEQMEQIMI